MIVYVSKILNYHLNYAINPNYVIYFSTGSTEVIIKNLYT